MQAPELALGVAALQRTRRDPIWWVEQTFGEKVIGKQRELLELAATPDLRELHCKSCHDSGKTHTVSRLALWWLMCWPGDSIVVTTAPSWNQVKNLLWREMRDGFLRAQRRGPGLGGRMLTTHYEPAGAASPLWYATGFSTDEPVNFQGFHAKHILVVVDEADGVPQAIWDAIDGIATSKHVLIVGIGNPIDPQSAWRKRFQFAQHESNMRTMTIADTDVLPLAATYDFLLQPEWVEDKRRRWSEGSPLWLSKVKAQWPDQGSDTLIPMRWLQAAVGKQVERGLRTYGVDVARFGVDRSVSSLMEGGLLLWQHPMPQQDTYVTASWVISEIQQYGPVALAIDAVGLGAGVVDPVRHWLRSQGGSREQMLTEHIANAKPIDPERFANRGSEVYWNVREGFEKGLFAFGTEDPEGMDELINQLNQPRFGYLGGGLNPGKIAVNKFGLKVTQSEAALDSETRASRSPDRADSFVITATAATTYIGKTEAPKMVRVWHGFKPGVVNA